MLGMFSSALARLSRAGRVCQSSASSAFSAAAAISDVVVPSTAICCLKESRAVLKIKGQDTSTFLQAGPLSPEVLFFAPDANAAMSDVDGNGRRDLFVCRDCFPTMSERCRTKEPQASPCQPSHTL